jgi:hypothetical protein
MGLVLGTLLLQGCASTAPVGDSGAQAHGGVQLFKADGGPRFNFYLACTSRTVNCAIIEREFDAWADTHQMTVHSVASDDPAFSTGKASQARDQTQPYRLAVRYSPEMAASNNSLSGGGQGLPVMSYTATINVFDAATGKLLKTSAFHDQKMIDQSQGAANPYLKAQVRAVLSHLDPAYVKGASAS